MRPYSQNVFVLVVAIIGFGKRQLKSRRGALGSRVDLIFQKNWHRYSCAILSYTLNISIARSLILCMETSKAWRDSGSVPFSLSQFLCSFFLPWSCVAIYIYDWLKISLQNLTIIMFVVLLEGFGCPRQGAAMFYKIIWRKDGCSFREVSSLRSTEILLIWTSVESALLQDVNNVIFILLHRRDSEDETGMDTGSR